MDEHGTFFFVDLPIEHGDFPVCKLWTFTRVYDILWRTHFRTPWQQPDRKTLGPSGWREFTALCRSFGGTASTGWDGQSSNSHSLIDSDDVWYVLICLIFKWPDPISQHLNQVWGNDSSASNHIGKDVRLLRIAAKENRIQAINHIFIS